MACSKAQRWVVEREPTPVVVMASVLLGLPAGVCHLLCAGGACAVSAC